MADYRCWNLLAAKTSSLMKRRRKTDEDSGHHLVIDFFSSESPSESQAPVESVSQQVLRWSNTDKIYK